jgi:MFS family permease
MVGKLSDKILPSKLATIGMLFVVLGITGLLFISPVTPIWYVIMNLVILGMGFGLFSSPNTNVIMSSVEPKSYGQASGITGTARLVGQTCSLSIAGLMLSIYVGENLITEFLFDELMKSIKATLIIFWILCSFGVYLSFRTRSNDKKILSG